MKKLISSKLPPPYKQCAKSYDYSLTNPQILITLLTSRELQILEFAIDGFTNKEIAVSYVGRTTSSPCLSLPTSQNALANREEAL